MPCDFLDDRTARKKVESFTGEPFNIGCGVPQGSVISPSLFIIYTRDIPQSIRGLNVCYADDITQIINYEGNSKIIINARTKEEVEQINKYEEKWKIKTNINKFTVIPLGSRRNADLVVYFNLVYFENTGTVLGQKINTHGFSKQTKHRKNKATHAQTKLYKLGNLPQTIKIHLMKALVIPVIDYPPIPTHALSNTQIRTLQSVQNKAIRFATNTRYPYEYNTRELHEIAKMKPVNIRLHERAKKIWNAIQEFVPETMDSLRTKARNIERYNTWFPSSLTKINVDPPPMYT